MRSDSVNWCGTTDIFEELEKGAQAMTVKDRKARQPSKPSCPIPDVKPCQFQTTSDRNGVVTCVQCFVCGKAELTMKEPKP